MQVVRIVVMGVSGSGKSTVAELLATAVGCPMLEGDSLHSAHNVERMAAGHALTDADRQDWLAAIAEHIAKAVAARQSLVVSCSALKRRYRDILRQADPRLIFVHLKGDKELVRSRLALRRQHFMSPALLDSQFEALEVPSADEAAIECSIALDPAEIVASILPRLR
jgi:carbohydrate kinase (thermoresistant glucokinase family)